MLGWFSTLEHSTDLFLYICPWLVRFGEQPHYKGKSLHKQAPQNHCRVSLFQGCFTVGSDSNVICCLSYCLNLVRNLLALAISSWSFCLTLCHPEGLNLTPVITLLHHFVTKFSFISRRLCFMDLAPFYYLVYSSCKHVVLLTQFGFYFHHS